MLTALDKELYFVLTLGMWRIAVSDTASLAKLCVSVQVQVLSSYTRGSIFQSRSVLRVAPLSLGLAAGH